MTSAGALAEQLAAQYLQRHGLTLLQRNYRCRFGEIDLICRHKDTLVFVEVRLRSHAAFGGAAASIDAHKQTRLVRAAQHYLASLTHVPPCRFDAILMQAPDVHGIEWVKNAFAA